MRGRKPTPTAIKRLTGNPGKRGLNRAEPTLPPAAPTAPRHLSPAAKKVWKRIAPQLAAARVLADVDTNALALYCTSYARWLEAETALQTDGLTVETKHGPAPHPMLRISRLAWDQVVKLSGEFGITPSARTRLKIDPGDAGEKSLAEQLFETLEQSRG
jgi:P27 family predicted phage terminase small subunit